MKIIEIKRAQMRIPAIGIGCMRMSRLTQPEAERYIATALELGLNFFDHADIYGGGESETIFAKAIGMNPTVRERVILQSKCGIKRGWYDSSKEHILSSVDAILKRLGTDYLDFLLIHRPDALVEPEEVAEAFDALAAAGKVRHFGVSNHNPAQMQLLQKSLNQKLAINQLQFGIAHTGMVDVGINVNMKNEAGINRDGSILDYCRLNDITIQPWSPFQYGFFEGVFIGSDKYIELNKELDKQAQQYGVTPSAVAIAWILRHPAAMQPIVGTMNAERLQEIAKAAKVDMTREEWYAIYRAAGNVLP